MTRRFTLASKIFAAVGVLTLFAAACSSNNKTAAPGTSSPTPSASASEHEQMMPLPPGAEKYKVNITSPASGLKLTANAITIHVSFVGFTSSCEWAGKDNKDGIAHYHVLLDKSLINMFCEPTATISMQNVKPGMHELAVAPALNDHAEVLENEQKISFDYEPTSPLKPIIAESTTSNPSIEILSPASGVTLSGPFTLKVRISNFEDACGLLGKPDVAGYGHWHLNVDSMTGAMMGMVTMLGMSCTDTITSTTLGLTPGTHTIFALLTDNGHAPLDIFDKIDVTVA